MHGGGGGGGRRYIYKEGDLVFICSTPGWSQLKDNNIILMNSTQSTPNHQVPVTTAPIVTVT